MRFLYFRNAKKHFYQMFSNENSMRLYINNLYINNLYKKFKE